MRLEYVAVNSLHFYENNPRKNDAVVPKMVDSIKEFGFRIPILALRDGTVLDGHLRLKGAIACGMEEVPVIWADGMSEEKVKAFRIMANRSASWASWDMSKLCMEMKDIAAEAYDLSMTGFSEEEREFIFSHYGEYYDESSTASNEDDVPEAAEDEKSIRVCRGDVWKLGEHRIMCGDATDAGDMDLLMHGDMADMWLTDPPYNVSYVGKTKDKLTISNDSMNDAAFREFLMRAYMAADAVMNQGAAFYIWHADSEGYNFRGAARDAGWNVQECLIWAKQHFVIGRQDYQWKHEPCLYGWKGEGRHWHGGRDKTTVLEFDRPMRNAEHPTMKPVALFEFLIGNSSRHGQIVLDSFGGSGTTVIACEKMKRRARVMELSPVYADVIIRRWEEFSGMSAEILCRKGE